MCVRPPVRMGRVRVHVCINTTDWHMTDQYTAYKSLFDISCHDLPKLELFTLFLCQFTVCVNLPSQTHERSTI